MAPAPAPTGRRCSPPIRRRRPPNRRASTWSGWTGESEAAHGPHPARRRAPPSPAGRGFSCAGYVLSLPRGRGRGEGPAEDLKIQVGVGGDRWQAGDGVGEDGAEARPRLDARVPGLGILVAVPG